ncbi:MAG: type II secretion system protein [Planctomycetota bacterium]
MRPRAFTLLESLLALGIVSSVLIVTLALRTQSMQQGDRLASMLAIEREADALTTMAMEGMLGNPDIEAGSAVWTGVHLERPYRVVARPVVMRNPVAGASNMPLAETVTVVEFTVEYRGRSLDFLAPAPAR